MHASTASQSTLAKTASSAWVSPRGARARANAAFTGCTSAKHLPPPGGGGQLDSLLPGARRPV